MKYFYILLLLFTFNGCSDYETAQEREDRIEEEELEAQKADKHITYGGDGNISNPYIIGDGIYGSHKDSDTYYEFITSGGCNILIYEHNDKSNFLLFNSDYSFYDINSTQIENDTNNFNLYSSLEGATYLMKNDVESIDDSRFGIYGTCINHIYDYELSTPINGLNYFDTSTNLYKISLDIQSMIKINEVVNIENFYIFDENLNLIDSISDSTFNNSFEAGIYYLLIGRVSDSEATFYFNIEE